MYISCQCTILSTPPDHCAITRSSYNRQKNALNLHNLGHPVLIINHLPIQNQRKVRSRQGVGTVFNDLINLALTIQVNRLIIYFQDDEAILQMGIFLEEHVHMLPLANTTVGYFLVFLICFRYCAYKKSSSPVHIVLGGLILHLCCLQLTL